MNRLWVRLSLAFAAVVIVVMIILGFATRIILESIDIPPGNPPETTEYLQRFREDTAPFSMTAVLSVVGVVAIGAGVWMSKTLTAPLEQLEDAAQAIGRQDLSYRLTVRGTAELRAVATGFNDMAYQLEQAESLRRQLLADVAHELRNPLHVLAGNLQAMLDDVYPLTKKEIARLTDQTRHLATLVDDLHELAQAEANQLKLDRRPTDIVSLIKEAAAAFQPVAKAQGVKLQVALHGTLPSSLDVDANRFRQVISNLLSNSLRHTADGGEIWVTLQMDERALCIQVRDSGAGIAPEHLDHVFDRFYRTDGARSRDRGGTGLGLAIVRAIVAEHGGTVTAESPGLNEGSTFTISLPMDASTRSEHRLRRSG